VGEWWSILILRDCFHGRTRFDEFVKSLGIAPNMLSRRLHDLVKTGLLGRRQYSSRPARYEYILTDRGRDFQSVLAALLIWGNKHFSAEGGTTTIINRETGMPADPVWMDRTTGLPLSDPLIITATYCSSNPNNPQVEATS
jgi:DNA-binding HxlR family transcriptional regulator